KNADYVRWLRGQIALLDGRADDAAADFAALAAMKDSRFAREAAWRAADAAWEAGRKDDAVKAYTRLRGEPGADDRADLGVVAYRVADASGNRTKALRGFLVAYPAHPLAAQVERELGGVAFSDDERIERAQRLITAHLWDAAVAELMLIDE